jgi:pantothenate kinase
VTTVQVCQPTAILAAMDSTCQTLAERAVAIFREKSTRKQSDPSSTGSGHVLIALAGPPGSSKTTLAHNVTRQIQSLPSPPSTYVVSLDGFHLTHAKLLALPNAEEAVARRGAPWTFDAAAAVELVRQLTEAFGVRDMVVPTFDHAVKEPVSGGRVAPRDTQVCIIEGNYVLSDEGVWGAVAGLVDERWLLQVHSVLARDRVAARHRQCYWPGRTATTCQMGALSWSEVRAGMIG